MRLLVNKLSLYALFSLYFFAGIYHLINPEVYMKIMPNWLGWHRELVIISGIAESTLGVLLVFKPTRRHAAWGIIALLIVVFPANIQMMLNYVHENNPMLWLAILRLPLQVLLIYWAYTFTKKPRMI